MPLILNNHNMWYKIFCNLTVCWAQKNKETEENIFYQVAVKCVHFYAAAFFDVM